MRLLISEKCKSDMNERKAFIESLSHCKFIKSPTNYSGFYGFQSFPFNHEPNICLIVGHNADVAELLNSESYLVIEKNIFIISCAVKYKDSYKAPGKNVYLCKQRNEYVLFRDGKDFNVDFDITDTELDLYNTEAECLLKRFEKCFNKIWDEGNML